MVLEKVEERKEDERREVQGKRGEGEIY